MKESKLTIRDAKIGFRNFSGRAGDYNEEGDRNFCLFLDHDLSVELKEDGWNIRYTKPKDPDEMPKAYMPVKASFGRFPPRVVQVTSRNKNKLSEHEMGEFDVAEIIKVDVTVRPHRWNRAGKSGVTAYLKTLYVTIAEDDFESDYYDIPYASDYKMTPVDVIDEDEVPF